MTISELNELRMGHNKTVDNFKRGWYNTCSEMQMEDFAQMTWCISSSTGTTMKTSNASLIPSLHD